jgi:hypothetical protein
MVVRRGCSIALLSIVCALPTFAGAADKGGGIDESTIPSFELPTLHPNTWQTQGTYQANYSSPNDPCAQSETDECVTVIGTSPGIPIGNIPSAPMPGYGGGPGPAPGGGDGGNTGPGFPPESEDDKPKYKVTDDMKKELGETIDELAKLMEKQECAAFLSGKDYVESGSKDHERQNAAHLLTEMVMYNLIVFDENYDDADGSHAYTDFVEKVDQDISNNNFFAPAGQQRTAPLTEEQKKYKAVVMDPSGWSGMTPAERLMTVAHEIGHASAAPGQYRHCPPGQTMCYDETVHRWTTSTLIKQEYERGIASACGI